MIFCASINCIDGRIQRPIQDYLKKNYNIVYVDTITEAGPCRILAENKDSTAVNSIIGRVTISVSKHGSKLIAVSGHYDCAGNPCDEGAQKKQIRKSMEFLKRSYPGIEVIGLWVDSEWKVLELEA